MRRARFVLPIAALAVVLTGCGSGGGESTFDTSTTVTFVEPKPLVVVRATPTSVAMGKPVTVKATSSEPLGKSRLELTVRAGTGPANKVGKPCTVGPCSWTVTQQTPGTYSFIASLRDHNGNIAATSRPAHVRWKGPPPPPQPKDIKLFVNGKQWPVTALIGGTDNYNSIPPGPLTVEAQWKNDAAGSGYHIVIGTEEPSTKTYAMCRTGTSCVVASAPSIAKGQEMSWSITLVTDKGNFLRDGFKMCFVGDDPNDSAPPVVPD